MERNLSRLASEEYDLLIIGAGIYGACAAWDAASRGLKVAVVERGDFGSGTSQNSLKIIHGGLRYLQQADIVRMRESIRERRILTRIAPHFVHPLPCLMPTYGHFTKGREALFCALLLNDLIGFDRNRLDDPEKHLPRGRTVSKQRILELLPGVSQSGLTGGALWYDCQTHNSERLLLSFLLSASDAGAEMANYAEVTGFLKRGRRVIGVEVSDSISNEKIEIRAKLILNTAGPWANKVLALIRKDSVKVPLRLSTAMNLVTSKIIKGHAAGLSNRSELFEEDAFVRKGSQVYFVAPWRHVSLVGTAHLPYEGDPDNYRVTETEIKGLLAEINRAYPSAGLKREDVHYFYGGLLPMKGIKRKSGEVNLVKHYRIVDHQREDGLEGLITVVGVKYTTARDVAERTVDLALKRLGVPFVKSRSAETPIYGGRIESFNNFLAKSISSRPKTVTEEIMTHMVYHYGSNYRELLNYIKENPNLANPLPGQRRVTRAEVVHAVRKEMANRLTDIVLRRTELGSAGNPGDDCLEACAEIMANELGWDEDRKKREIEAAKAVYIPKV